MFESYEKSYHRQERHEFAEQEKGEVVVESVFKPVLHVGGKPSIEAAKPVNESLISEQQYIGSADASSEDKSSIIKKFDGIKHHVIGKDTTVEDWLTLHQRQHYYEPAPSREEVYCAVLGCKPENLYNVDKKYSMMMRSLVYYAMFRAAAEGNVYQFDDVKTKIKNRDYSYPSGSKELSVISIGLNKAIHVPKFFHLYAKSRDGKQQVIVNIFTGYQSVDMTIYSDKKDTMEKFIDWFEAQIDKFNFLKGGKIDGKGNFLDIDKNMDWDAIVLPPGVRQQFEREILTMFSMQHIYDANGVPAKAGAALLGPPGTGKTTLIKILANKLDGVTVIVVSPDSLPYGSSSVREIYGMANKLSPSLVVWEDCDVHLGDRGSFQSGGGILSEVMNMLDGIVPLKNVVTLISSNRPQALEQALINRPGRIDCKIFLGAPDDTGRFDLLARFLKKVKCDPADVKKVALDARIKKFTPCYIAELAKRAIKKAISDGRFNKQNFVASVSYEDLSISIDEILKEVAMDGDYTKITVSMEGSGDPVPMYAEDALIESLETFGDLYEGRVLKKVEGYIKIFMGDESLDFSQTIERNRRARIVSLLDDVTQLRRLGVKRDNITTASKLADEPDSTYKDIALILAGGK